MNISDISKKCLPDILAIAFFVLISVAYFFVPMTHGEVLGNGDNTAGKGLGRDLQEYTEKTGETSRWTNSVFSGMPTYQIAPSYKSTSVLTHVEQAYHLWLPQYVWYLFAYLLGSLHSVARLRLPTVAGCIGLSDMGLLVLFPHHHCSWTYLESHGIGLSPADDSRHSSGV